MRKPAYIPDHFRFIIEFDDDRKDGKELAKAASLHVAIAAFEGAVEEYGQDNRIIMRERARIMRRHPESG